MTLSLFLQLPSILREAVQLQSLKISQIDLFAAKRSIAMLL
jgi:hypothetical protein